MAVAAFVTLAGIGSGTGIQAELQTFAVNIIRERLHIRKFAVRVKIALRIALAFPGVVDGDVDVTGVAHPVCGDRVGHSADDFIADAPVKLVPTVPTHGRSARKSAIPNFVKRGQRDARGQGALPLRDAMRRDGSAGRPIANLCDAQFIAGGSNFVAGAGFATLVGHDAGDRETVGTAGTFGDGVDKLRGANAAGDPAVLLLQMKPDASHGAVAVGCGSEPVAGHIGRGAGNRRGENQGNLPERNSNHLQQIVACGW